jgi:hypothetical protein
MKFKDVTLEIRNQYDYIHFSLDDSQFKMVIIKKLGVYIPLCVRHQFQNKAYCRFCEENDAINCTYLGRRIEDVFDELKKHPSIRLYLLYK